MLTSGYTTLTGLWARHRAVKTMFEMAREDGVHPRLVVAALYGVDVRRVDAWRGEAIKAGLMPPYDPNRDVPALWPPPQFREEREGEHAGRHLDLRATRAVTAHDDDRADVVVEGRWLDGSPFPAITLENVDAAEQVHRLCDLARELEDDKYPGATVRITVPAPFGRP
jgi:hypothetical protein